MYTVLEIAHIIGKSESYVRQYIAKTDLQPKTEAIRKLGIDRKYDAKEFVLRHNEYKKRGLIDERLFG